MAYATLHRLAFQRVDETGVPVDEVEIVEQGGKVPDYVRPYEIQALRSAGVIVDMGDDEDAIARLVADPTARELPPYLPNPEVPPTIAGNPVLHSTEAGPEDFEGVGGVSVPKGMGARRDSSVTKEEGPARGQQTSKDGPEEPLPLAKLGLDESGSSETDQPEPAKPSSRDTKQAWEDYAESRGIPRGEAESMTKQELITAVESREAESA
jgi:hypothetical protein